MIIFGYTRLTHICHVAYTFARIGTFFFYLPFPSPPLLMVDFSPSWGVFNAPPRLSFYTENSYCICQGG
ncbi:hypothetical protein K492DRAFT_48894 [Lichtheimia hyalospora FSU 10163]|nr:hypothetical protein K492DRAFT_48894 [Lichtheimia hyalospora FSU 10163]